MTIKVIDRESHFTIGDFHIEVDTLEEDGRTWDEFPAVPIKEK